MTDFETLVLAKLDKVHDRIDDVHARVTEQGESVVAHNVHITSLVGIKGDNGRVGKIEAKLATLEADKSERKGMSKLGKIAWAAIVGILGSDFLAHASELLKKLVTTTTR